MGEIAVVALAFYWVVGRSGKTEAPKAPAPVTLPDAAAEEPREAPPSFLPPRTPPWPTDEGSAPPRPVPATAHGPSPSPSAKPERAELDVEREAGEKHLEQTLTKLAREMTRLSENAGQFEAVCLSRRADPPSCARLYEDMSSASDSLERGLEGAEDEARHAWVSPGVVRDLRQKHGLEEGAWKDLALKVRRLAREYQGLS
jgi:hypothetical protein